MKIEGRIGEVLATRGADEQVRLGPYAQVIVDEHPNGMRLGYRPLKLGCRFSRNACTPSRKSSHCVAAA